MTKGYGGRLSISVCWMRIIRLQSDVRFRMRRKWATSGLRPLMLNAAFKNSGPLHAGCDCNRKENVVPVSTGSLFWQSSTVQFRMILILASNKVQFRTIFIQTSNKVQFRTIFIQTSNKVQFMTIIIQTGNKVQFRMVSTRLATAFIITICSPSHSNGLFFSLCYCPSKQFQVLV